MPLRVSAITVPMAEQVVREFATELQIINKQTAKGRFAPYLSMFKPDGPHQRYVVTLAISDPSGGAGLKGEAQLVIAAGRIAGLVTKGELRLFDHEKKALNITTLDQRAGRMACFSVSCEDIESLGVPTNRHGKATEIHILGSGQEYGGFRIRIFNAIGFLNRNGTAGPASMEHVVSSFASMTELAIARGMPLITDDKPASAPRVTPMRMVKAKLALQEAIQMLNSPSDFDTRASMLEAAKAKSQEATSMLVSAKGVSATMLWAEAMLINAECTFKLGGVDEGLTLMLASADGYYSVKHEGKNPGLANCAYAIARAYSFLADSDRAAVFAAETYVRMPRWRPDMRRLAWVFGAMIAAGDRSEVVEFFKGMPEDGWSIEQLHEPEASMMRILEHASGFRKHSLEDLLAAYSELASLPPEDSILFALIAARELRSAQRHSEADIALRGLLDQLQARGVPSWTTSGLRQVRAGILLDLRRYQAALDEGIAAWASLDESRYATGSPRLRRTIHDSFAPARRVAMQSAVRLQDWPLLGELIEAARLQASPDFPASLAEFDAMTEGRRIVRRRERDPAVRNINVSNLPELYRYIYDDVMESRSKLKAAGDVTFTGISALASAREWQARSAPHLKIERVKLALEEILPRAFSDGGLWWSTWCERDYIFWTLVSAGAYVDGGEMSLREDANLRDALTACHQGNGLTPPWPVDSGATENFDHALLACDSPEELDLTGQLARLLPPRLLEYARQGPSVSPKPTLLMSTSAELACVPWPILPITGSSISPGRLVEHFVLQSVPSLSSLTHAFTAVSTERTGNIRFLMSCDYFEPDSFPVPPRHAERKFGSTTQCGKYEDVSLATLRSVLAYLRGQEPGTPGLTVFRTHLRSVEGDPTSSGFELRGGLLNASWLLAHDRNTSRPITGMSSRVLLSCCSSAAAGERYGGESLGLVAGCFHSGADSIIATAVDIPHASFTNTFDEMLIDMLLHHGDHVAGLNSLQCRMLSEWRLYGSRDIYDDSHDVRHPLPVIWAYYQSYATR